MHTNLKDEELIQRVQTGDESAFTELMSRYSPRVWKVVIAKSRQRRDAEEILMDIWRAVWENVSGPTERRKFWGMVTANRLQRLHQILRFCPSFKN